MLSKVYTGPPPEVNLNPDSRPRSTGGLSYSYCDLDLIYMELNPDFGFRKVVPCKQGLTLDHDKIRQYLIHDLTRQDKFMIWIPCKISKILLKIFMKFLQ